MLEKTKELFGGSIELDEGLFVSAEKFAELFSEAEEFSYVELMRVEEENDYGYKKYIEEWKKEGLIEWSIRII